MVRIKTAIITLALCCIGILVEAKTYRLDPGAPDTLFIDSVRVAIPLKPALRVSFFNDEPLGALEVTVRHSAKGMLVIDSFSFVGGRTSSIGALQGFRVDSNIISAYCYTTATLIPNGRGLLGTLYFSYLGTPTPQLIPIDTITVLSAQIEHSTSFSDAALEQIRPQYKRGYIDLKSPCCIGKRGNVDGSADGVVDISDLQFLLDILTDATGTVVPPCPEAANADGSPDGVIDISDIVAVIDYLTLPITPIFPDCP